MFITNNYHTVNAELSSPKVLQYEAESFAVLVEWVQENGASFQASIIPQALSTTNGSTSVHLTLSYNVLYHLNVEASLCGGNTTFTLIL